MLIKNLTITQQIGYLALVAFVFAVIFISLYFMLGVSKYIKAANNHKGANSKNKSNYKPKFE